MDIIANCIYLWPKQYNTFYHDVRLVCCIDPRYLFYNLPQILWHSQLGNSLSKTLEDFKARYGNLKKHSYLFIFFLDSRGTNLGAIKNILTVLAIMFQTFAVFQCGFHSLEVKWDMISSIIYSVCELPHELPNHLRLMIIGNQGERFVAPFYATTSRQFTFYL